MERALFVDEHGALRATWHDDAEAIVVSLWRGAVCQATFRLTPEEAGRLAEFLERFAPDPANPRGARREAC